MAKHNVRSSGILQIGALAAVAGATVNSAIFAVGRASDVPFRVVDGGSEEAIDVGGVAGMSVVAMTVGLVAVALAYRYFGRRSLRPFAIVGGLLALASNVGFPGMDATVATKWSLASMHIVIGVAYIAGLEIVRARQASLPNTASADSPDHDYADVASPVAA